VLLQIFFRADHHLLMSTSIVREAFFASPGRPNGMPGQRDECPDHAG
jgi:hypothetical protein